MILLSEPQPSQASKSATAAAESFIGRVKAQGERSRRRLVSPSDFIAEEIARLITCGAFESGDRLREAEMAERFNVSRTIIREAFSQLKKSGLIDSARARGVRVAVLTPDHVLDLYEVRSVLLMLAARRAVERADRACGEALEEGVPILKALAAEPSTSLSLFLGVHTFLGSAVVVAAGNPELTETLTASRYTSVALPPERAHRGKTAGPGHNWVAFADAFRKGDGSRATQIIQAMVEESRAELLRQLAGPRPERSPAGPPPRPETAEQLRDCIQSGPRVASPQRENTRGGLL
jgi:DNA-binding GntR family transcriptional regulator